MTACDCSVEDIILTPNSADYVIRYCVLHEAAPRLTEVLQANNVYIQHLRTEYSDISKDSRIIKLLRENCSLIRECGLCSCLPNYVDDRCPKHSYDPEKLQDTQEMQATMTEERIKQGDERTAEEWGR